MLAYKKYIESLPKPASAVVIIAVYPELERSPNSAVVFLFLSLSAGDLEGITAIIIMVVYVKRSSLI